MVYFSFVNSCNNFQSICGLEIILVKKAVIIIAEELAENEGMSITNAFEDLFFQVCREYKLDAITENIVWVEKYGDIYNANNNQKKSKGTEGEYSLVEYKIRSSNQAIYPRWKSIGTSRQEVLDWIEENLISEVIHP